MDMHERLRLSPESRPDKASVRAAAASWRCHIQPMRDASSTSFPARQRANSTPGPFKVRFEWLMLGTSPIIQPVNKTPSWQCISLNSFFSCTDRVFVGTSSASMADVRFRITSLSVRAGSNGWRHACLVDASGVVQEVERQRVNNGSPVSLRKPLVRRVEPACPSSWRGFAVRHMSRNMRGIGRPSIRSLRAQCIPPVAALGAFSGRRAVNLDQHGRA